MTDFTIYNFTSLESTNDTAKNYTDNFSVIVAGEQTKGKGRRGKTWISPKGGLYFSVVITDPDLLNLGIYSLTAALSLCEALPAEANAKIKWPNDILIGGKKVSGILLETATDPSRLIIGIGINISSFPKESLLSYAATSLKNENITITKDELLASLLDRLANNLTLPLQQIITLWQKNAIGIGKDIKVTLAKGTLFGVFKGLDAKGNLILSTKNKEKPDKIISCGEIYF